MDHDATYFTGNKLHASIVGDFVANRSYTSLNFTGATSDKCSLGTTNSYWTQNVRADYNCQDQFNFTLPWVNHQDCNFHVNNGSLSAADQAEFMLITGRLWISYIDYLDEVESFKLTRSTKVPYAMSVKFQRHVNVQLLTINVTSNVVFGVALTEDVYDPIQQQLTLQLTTIVNWPNSLSQLVADSTINFPTGVEGLTLDPSSAGAAAGPTVCSGCAGAVIIMPYTGAQDCQVDPTFLPSCKQTWTLIANQLDKTRCNFDGKYSMNVTLYTCRAPSPASNHDCTNAIQPIEFEITDSDTCGQIEVKPTLTGELVSFPDTVTSGFRAASADPTKTKTTFSLGTYARFYAKIDSGVGNKISIVFNQVQFWDQADSSNKVTLYDTVNNIDFTGFITIDNMNKAFRIYFHSSIFKVKPNQKVTYTFSAVATVSFEGNDGYVASPETRKREVEFTWEQSSMDAQTNVFLASSEESSVVPQTAAATPAVNGVTFIASVVGAVAGTMIIVFVVVGFALRSRSKNEYKDVATSAAIVAANAAAEVANRS